MSNSRLSLKTKSWLCFTPVTRTTTTTTTRTPHQNISEGGVLEGWNLTHRPIMGFWLSLGVQMTHVTRRTRRTSPKSTITEHTKNLIVAPKILSDPKFFQNQYFFQTQIFFDTKFFWMKNFFRMQKFFFVKICFQT